MLDTFSGNIQPHSIEDEIKDSFLSYAMSVIVSRALPDVRDGLKPVHRRGPHRLHDVGPPPHGGPPPPPRPGRGAPRHPVPRRVLSAMHDVGLQPNRPYRKSATVVGEVIGKYHPHGDSAVYDTLTRLAQDSPMRHPRAG